MTRFAAILLTIVACTRPPLTEIILEVDSDFPADGLDFIRIEVARGGEMDLRVVNLAERRVPFSMGIVHREGALGPVAIAVEGSLAGTSIVRQLRSTVFVVGQSERMQVVLSPACIDVVCPDGLGCADGICIGPGDAGVPDVGATDGDTSDGGVLDAGSDSGMLDAPTLDMSVDSQTDAAPTDAMIDAGADTPDVNECPTSTVSVEGSYRCPDGCTCMIQCPSDDLCGVQCGEGTSCHVVASPRSRLNLDCTGAVLCTAEFRNSASMVANCDAANCDFDCDRASSCTVACTGTATCLLYCPVEIPCEFSTCGDETICSASDRSCNRACF